MERTLLKKKALLDKSLLNLNPLRHLQVAFTMALVFGLFSTSFAQVTIGTGTSSTTFTPIYTCYGYSYTEQIYLQSEIGASGNISSISFYMNSKPSSTANSDSVTVYLGHTTLSNYATSTSWIGSTGMTQVYDGVITYPANGNWMTITLATPFAYNNIDNLVVAVDENRPGWNCSVNFAYTSAGANSSIYYRNDNINPDPSLPPTSTGRTANRANIQLGGITQACPAPTAFAASGITTSGASIAWTSGSSLSNVEYGPAGFTPGSGTTLTGVTSPQSLSSLSPATAYDVYIIDDCGAGGLSIPLFSSFSTSIQGAVGVTCTTPGANSTVLFTEEFDNNTAGWTGDIGSSGGQWEIPDGSGSSNTGASSAHSGSNYMNLEASGFATGNTASIVTPAIDMSAAVNDAELSFWMHAFGTDMGNLDVGVGTSATGPFTTVFSWSGQLQTSGTAPWQNVGVNLASYVGQTIYVEYKMTSTTGGFTSDMSIDLMEVTSCLSCVAPSALMDSNLTSSSASISWTAGLNETAWDVQWGPTGFALGTGDSAATTFNPAALVGLTPNTTYDFYVRADCGGTSGVSGWAGPHTFTTLCASQLSGTVTIDANLPASATNFQSFNALANEINPCGISGALTVNVASGTYNEEVTFENIVGTSSTNTITINGGGATIAYDGANTQSATIRLRGTKHMTIDNLTIVNTESSSYGWGIHLVQAADSNTISNCTININETSTSSTFAGIISSNSNTSTGSYGNNANNTMVSNCTINGGYYGVRFNGVSSGYNADNSIMNCTFNNLRYYGVYYIYQDDPTASGNTINHRAGVTSGYGMYANQSSHADMQGNTINGAYTYGIRFFNVNTASQSPTQRAVIANNMIIAKNFGDGIYLGGSDDVDVFHNTVTAENDQALWINSSSGDYDVRNNVFSITGSSYVVDLDAAPAVATETLNNNVYYNSGTGSIAQVASTNYATLVAWQTGDADQNSNSLEGDPVFAGPTDLHLLGPLANDAGDNTVGITVDIDGDTRPSTGSTNVDIGADEFTAVSGDLALLAGMIQPSSCYSSNDTAVFYVQNVIGGTVDFSVDNLTLTWDVMGPFANSNGSVTVNTGTLPAGDTLMVIATGVDVSAAGNYMLNAYIGPNGANQSTVNDTLSTVSFSESSLLLATPSNTVITSGSDTVELAAFSPFFPNGGFFITEVCHFAGSSTGAPTGGKPSWLFSDDYIEITGSPGSDLGGYTLETWTTFSLTYSYTFPSGTLLSPNGTAIIGVGSSAGSADPANFYYPAQGGSYSSGSAAGRILKDSQGNIEDAVGYSGSTVTAYVFPAGANVPSTDWSSSITGGSGSWGIRLEGADVNSGTNWVLSATSSQNPNAVNTSVTVPATPPVVGFSWNLNGAPISTNTTTVVGPWAINGTYKYIAAYNSASCGMVYDTATVVVNLPLSQVDLPITFDNVMVDYNPISFGGAIDSIRVDPTDPTNTVLRQDKPTGAQPWAGTTLGGSGLATAVPFAAGSTMMNARIWSPDSGTPILLKVEDVTDPTISVETFAYTTQAATWETLNFDFSNQAPGTSPIDLTKTYDKISVFCDFLNTAAGKTFFVDDVQFGVFLSPVDLPITFEDPFVDYNPTSFGGAIDSIRVDPTDPTNTVLRQDKPTGAQPWAGTTLGGSGLANAIPFAAGSTMMNARIWSPDSGTPVLLKVEDATDPTISVETFAYTTQAATWQTLSFDFSNQAPGTSPIDFTKTYDKISVFCDFLNTAAGKTFFVDDVQFGMPPCQALSAPYAESFEGSSWTIPASSCNYSDGIDPCWARIPNGYSPMSWVMRSSNTCSGNTGPDSANTGSNYVYLETSQGGPDAELWMQSIDISSLTNAQLKFYYHMYGATIGTLYTEISTDGGTTWATLDSIIGAQQASSSDAWTARFIDISAYSGVVTIRYRGTYGGSFTGDIAIDDISVDNAASACPITDVPVGTGATSCGPNPVTLLASGNTVPTQGYFWMRSADSAIVGMDDSYTTPPVTATTDYLLGIGTINTAIAKQHVGPLPNIATSGYGNFSNGQWFHADDFFYLDSITVNSNGPLSFAVRISDPTAAGAGTELIRSDTITVTGAGDHQVAVDLAIAPGEYFINIVYYTTGGTGQLFRATSGAVYPYVINNLVSIDSVNFPGTRYYYTYDWVVSEVCYSTLDVVTATSGAIPPTSFPYAEDFNTGLPCNWTTDNVAGGADWMNVQDYFGSSLDSSAFMFIDDDAPGSGTITEASLLSPVFNTQGYDTLFMSFDHYFRAIGNSVGYVEVYDGATWVAVDSFSTNTGAWSGPVTQSYDVTAYQNTDLQVRFRYDDGGSWGWYWAVDNFAMDGLQTPCENVVVDILTDSWGSETTWSITDTATGTVYASGGPYPNTIITHYVDSVCLPLGVFFEFRLNDSYGDGLFDGTNTGTYDVDIICSWGANNVISGSGAFPYGGPAGTAASWDSTIFEVTCAQPGCFDPVIVSDSVNCSTLFVDWISDTSATTRMEYGPTGFAPGTGTLLTNITTPYVATGLTNGIAYDYYLVDSCANGNLSDTVWGTSFTTDPLPVAAFIKSVAPPANRLDTVTWNFNAAPSQNETLQVWNYGDGSPLDSGLVKSHDYTANGTFDVILYVYNSCGVDSDTQQVVISTIGLEENGINNFALYPNPNKGRFTLNGTLDVGGEIQIEVLSMTGALVHSQKVTTGQQIDIDIDLTGEASGVYQVRIISAKGIAIKPFVIQD